MTEQFDAVIVGMGPGGEVVASRLLSAGRRVAVVERELIGGECAYWACIPSKTVLRGGEVLGEAERVAGVDGTTLSWPAMRHQRDQMVRHLDDHAQVEAYERKGARVVRGEARIEGHGSVVVGGEVIEATHVVVATGSEAVVPDVEGLGDRAWTSRDIYSTHDLPEKVAVVGGSAVGVETALFLARYGARVTVVQRGDRLLSREEPAVGELARKHLEAVGADVRTGVTARRGLPGRQLELDDGSMVGADVVVFGTGRRPRTADLGLEAAGAELDENGAIRVDDRCQAAEGLWAVGDVTGVMPFTHVAKYQGRVVADCIVGRPRRATYEGIPRVVFADPEIAAVGLTASQAAARGIDSITADIDVPEAISRPWTYETEPRGRLGLLADAEADVLIGAWAVAPLAGEWIHQAALAIRARIPIEVLLDQVAQFPTYAEAYLTALEALPRR